MKRLAWFSVMTLLLTNFYSAIAEEYVADDATDLFSAEDVDVVESPELSEDTLNLLGGGNADLLDHFQVHLLCLAQNLRGETFSAVGVKARRVQEKALHKCEAVSRHCDAIGCRIVD